MAHSRRPIYFNPGARVTSVASPNTPDLIAKFHQGLPDYGHTELVSLDNVAKEIGVRRVVLKDESSRFGLSSFKFLGASWGAFRAIASYTGCQLDVVLDEPVSRRKLM